MSSVRSEVVVEAPADRAFRVFTEKMETWWPASHHIGKVPFRTIVLDRRANGRWAEIGDDGSECDWGRVLVWDPPKRVVLGWQLTADWHYDANFVTEVEINFTPMDAGKTRVALEHRNLERFGKNAEAFAKSISSEGGWPLILNSFAAIAAERNPVTAAASKVS
jgi:uncharacterized protein YndB with AHSA1/START domain